jgi:hypothetical protein
VGLFAYGDLIFVVGLAISIWSVLLHNALSGEWFWDFGFAPVTNESIWTYSAGLAGLLLLAFGLMGAAVHDALPPSSQPHMGQ